MLFLATLAWILGMGSLALFGIFLWTGGLDIIDLRLTRHLSLAFDAALCLVFFLQHSVLIRRSVRSALKNVIPVYCQGVAYTLSSAVALSGLVLLWQRSAASLYVLSGAGYWAMRVVLLLAFVGFFWGILSLKRFDAFGTEALLAYVRKEQTPPAKLTIEGPYRLVRHPFYAFAIVALWATPVFSFDRLLLNVLFTGWIVLGAVLEERDLLAQFGEDYVRYRCAVPMFLPRAGRQEILTKPKANSGRRVG